MSAACERRARPTIRQQLAVFGAVLALPLLIALGYAAYAARQSSAASARDTTVQLARLAAAGVGQFVDESRVLLGRAGRGAAGATPGPGCASRLAQLPALRPEFVSVALVDRAGRVVCGGPGGPPPGASAAGSPWLEQARRTGRFTVADVPSHAAGRRLAVLAAPLRRGGATDGYLAITIDLLRYQSPFSGLALPAGAVVGILDRNGIVEARSLAPGLAVGRRYDPLPAADGRPLTATGRDGVRRIYSAAPVPGTRWLAYAGVSTSSAFAASDRLLHAVLVAALGALLLTGLAAAFVTRRIARPVRRLASAAARVAAGDRETYAFVGGPAEIAAAAAEFNRMVDATAAAEDERERTTRRLAQAEKMEAVGRLAGGVAHDFNNLLLAIRGYGELALQRLEGDEPAAEDIKGVLDAAHRAGRLTHQLLTFGRRQPLQPAPLDLREVVGEMEQMLRRLISEDIELAAGCLGDPVVVLADRGQIEQVIANLVINARDAMPDGGRLTIDVAEAGLDASSGTGLAPGRYAVLSVADTGCGMDNETVTHVFEPFFSTKGDLGTGLGLATVHGIAAQSGGEVQVSSAPGAGSTFTVYLPLHEGRQDEDAAGAPALLPAGRGDGTVLLVEDDPSVREIVRLMLEQHGYRVLVAEDGGQAADLAAGHDGPIDLVVTDLVMPGLSGPEAAERIRAARPEVLVLYMSGYADSPLFRTGATLDPRAAFIQKPFGAAELCRKIDALLDPADAP